MTALRADAAFGSTTTPGWYEVTLAGLNYVDDQCVTYFDRLFKLNRRKDALKSAFASFDQTTAAILHATGAATLTMNIVAQVFGLGSRLTDIVAGTYLYQLPPATTLRFVEETLHAYKIKVTSERAQIDSPAAAYGYIRGYLNLCLPATIEGSLVDHIGGARAEASNDGAGSIAVRVISDVSVFDMPEFQRLSDPGGVNNDLDVGPAPKLPTTLEKTVSEVEWAEIQSFLCVPNTDGQIGPETRKSISQFFLGSGKARSGIEANGISAPQDLNILREIIEASTDKSCPGEGGTAFTVGQRSAGAT